jgi:carbon storage regulator CsrA
MLVLSRRLNEEIHIGDDVVVKVKEIRKGRVRIGIIAPDKVRIIRGEMRSQPADKTPESANETEEAQ